MIRAHGLLAQLCSEETMKHLPDLMEKEMHKALIALQVPKFKFDFQVKLKEVLQEMDMEVAFGPEADFSNMAKPTEDDRYSGEMMAKIIAPRRALSRFVWRTMQQKGAHLAGDPQGVH